MPENNSPNFRQQIFNRANGKCECTMKTCKNHTGRCNAILRGEWEVHKLNPNGGYVPSNVLGMCQTCHRNTPSYGVGAR